MPGTRKRKTTKTTKSKATKKQKAEAENAASKKEETTHEHKGEEGTQILEKGFIYFFYRPKVNVTEVKGFEDVQRLYILLVPHPKEWKKGEKIGLDPEVNKRLIIVPKKMLPLKANRFFARIELVTKDLKEIKDSLETKVYETKTKGERSDEAARPCGEGLYAIVVHKGHTHLAYVLETPKEIGEVQEAFQINHEGSFIVTVKNPKTNPAAWTHLPQTNVNYPSSLLEKMGDYKFVPAQPVEFLDYTGADLILIGAVKPEVTLHEELGTAGEDIEEFEKIDEKRLTDDKLFKELHLNKEDFKPEPLLKGEWK